MSRNQGKNGTENENVNTKYVDEIKILFCEKTYNIKWNKLRGWELQSLANEIYSVAEN
jgi:hypothetical protein